MKEIFAMHFFIYLCVLAMRRAVLGNEPFVGKTFNLKIQFRDLEISTMLLGQFSSCIQNLIDLIQKTLLLHTYICVCSSRLEI